MAHEFDGEKYAQSSVYQRELGERLIAGLALQGNERVLDLGCGDGALSEQIARMLPQGEIIGIDASCGMIETAKQKQTGNMHFVLMDIDNIAFEDEFDLIFSNATFHWLKDHDRLLQNAYRALRPGGLMRCNFAADGNCSHLIKVIRRAMQQEAFSGCFGRFTWPWYMPTVAQYTQLVANSDFKDYEIRGENVDRFFPDSQSMIAWMDQPMLVPFLSSIPVESKESFRDYVITQMLQETRQADGTCFETLRRINFCARK